MSSSVTSYVSSPLSTVLFATTKIKLARTVAKSVIGNMTVLRLATSLPMLFVACVATLATLRAIVLTASVVQITAICLRSGLPASFYRMITTDS